MTLTWLLNNRRLAAECALVALATAAISALVVLDGRLPSAFTTLYFIPILVTAYRHPLPAALAITVVASFFSSPGVAVLGVEMDSSLKPVLWLGWPSVYLFLAVTLNQWASIKEQRERLEQTERHLQEVEARNDRRERELETISLIQNTILAGDDEAFLLQEITQRVAEATGAKLCSVVVPTPGRGERPYASYGIPPGAFDEVFPQAAPYGEGVAGWAILHGCVASSRDVMADARYERLRTLASVLGYRSAAAAPFEFDRGIRAALVIAYSEVRDFTAEELERLERLARQAELAVRSARQRESLARFAYDTAIVLTEAIESRDPYTGGHCHRLASLAAATARQLNLPRREAEIVQLGAALHDVGKIVVPDSILRKPGSLTPDEYAIVKQHCYSGGQICKRVPFLMDVYDIVYHHHERWDGQGYPDGLRGEQIPRGARIVAVVDAYDAMTSDRPYRQSMGHEAAVETLREGAGRQWDPEVVRAFLETVLPGEDGHRHSHLAHDHIDPFHRQASI